MTSASLTSFMALAVGFALAGVAASLYQMMTARRAGFYLLTDGTANRYAVAAMIAFAAPFLILRNILAMPVAVDPQLRILSVAAATIAAGLWSIASGSVLLSVLYF